MVNDWIIGEIAKNNKGEQEAIAGYFQLLDEIKRAQLPAELISQVEEIISDELNHSEKLTEWAEKLSGIKPAAD